VAFGRQAREDILVEPILSDEHSRLDIPGVEGAWEARRVPGRGVDGLLQGLTADQMPQEEEELPLVLLVASRRATGQHRLTVTVHHRGGKRRTRAAPWHEGGSEPLLEPEHLHAAAEREPELGDGRRAL